MTSSEFSQNSKLRVNQSLHRGQGDDERKNGHLNRRTLLRGVERHESLCLHEEGGISTLPNFCPT
jgi:hypothetical protein